jgi:hypothetical protein
LNALASTAAVTLLATPLGGFGLAGGAAGLRITAITATAGLAALAGLLFSVLTVTELSRIILVCHTSSFRFN